jgi:hypothetical protein
LVLVAAGGAVVAARAGIVVADDMRALHQDTFAVDYVEHESCLDDLGEDQDRPCPFGDGFGNGIVPVQNLKCPIGVPVQVFCSASIRRSADCNH